MRKMNDLFCVGKGENQVKSIALYFNLLITIIQSVRDRDLRW